MSPALHDTLSTALLEGGSIPAIEQALKQSLAESGWTTELRAYIANIVRSGEATNYQDILKKVMSEVTAGHSGERNGKAGDLKIPEKVVRDGVKVVRKELEKVVSVVVDD
jgi:hypothetical protein